jgi:hypothetical protein
MSWERRNKKHSAMGAFPKYDNYPEEAEKSAKASYHFHF